MIYFIKRTTYKFLVMLEYIFKLKKLSYILKAYRKVLKTISSSNN